QALGSTMMAGQSTIPPQSPCASLQIAHPDIVCNLPMIYVKERGATLLQSILANHKLDWLGIREKKPDAKWAGELLPVIRKNSEIHAAAIHEKAIIEGGLNQIQPGKMATLLHTMHGHYWQQGMSPELMKEVVKDY